MKPDYKLIYHNDLTNLLGCESPFHHAGEDFAADMIERSVDETGGLGVDAYFLQAGSGHLPLYPSNIYPLSEHINWWKQHYGVDPLSSPESEASLLKWILEGGDIIERFLNRCHQWGQAFFISQRVNDVHFAEHALTQGNFEGIHFLSRFYVGHLKDQLKDRTQYWFDWAPRALDWTNSDIPAYHLRLIEEQCEKYDIDGFDLDFMRYPAFFAEAGTTVRERQDIMAGFISQARAILNRTSRSGQRRFLSARIPSMRNKDDLIGLDLSQWSRLGVDFFTVSSFYFTSQEVDFDRTRQEAPDAGLYLEMTHATRLGEFLDGSRAKTADAFTFRRMTPFQFYTTASLAYAAGFDGATLFNFQYYRPHGSANRGPFNEPPFDVLPRLRNPQMLSRYPQHYFLSASHYIQHFVPEDCPLALRGPQLPQELAAGQEIRLRFTLRDNVHGAGVFRIETELPSAIQDQVSVFVGEELLTPGAPLDEPFDFQMRPLTDITKRGAAWFVPSGCHERYLEFRVIGKKALSGTHRVVFADLVFRDNPDDNGI
jgi:hypothetical protein